MVNISNNRILLAHGLTGYFLTPVQALLRMLVYVMNLRSILISILLAASLPALADSCHPEINSSLPQYVIGYGSLIQTQSKNQTYLNTGENIPVIVYGFKRGWFTKGSPIGFSTTFLGVLEDSVSHFNGVIFRIPYQKGLVMFDRREVFYCRQSVSPNNIAMLGTKKLPPGQYWIYVTKPESIALPSARYPLVQSYVDTFLSGCLEVETKRHVAHFANDCIDTTQNWSAFWVNDRIFPRRPYVYQPDAKDIDKLLNEKLPDLFSKITIESR